MSAILTLPEAVWEFSLGIHLIVKGFRPDASVFEETRDTSRPQDRPIPAVAAG